MDNYSKNGNEIKGLQFQQWCQEKGIAIPTKVPRKRDSNLNGSKYENRIATPTAVARKRDNNLHSAHLYQPHIYTFIHTTIDTYK